MSSWTDACNYYHRTLPRSFIIIFCLLAFVPMSTALAKPPSVKLIIKRDITCQHQSGPDHMLSTDTAQFTLPEQEGNFTSSGNYTMKGSASPVPGMNGYQLAGPAVYKGAVKDEVLILNFGQWHYQGQALNNSGAAMPSATKPVRLSLEPGSNVTVKFNETTHAIPCSGKVVYKLDFKPETQVWDVTLNGHRKLTYHSSVFVKQQGSKQLNTLNYDHGADFDYNLSARVVLTKKKKQWVYTSGTINKSTVNYDYFQNPMLYKVNKTYCQYCDKIEQLKGQVLDGDILDDILILFWPAIEPVVIIDSQLNPDIKCAPGEAYDTCVRQHQKASSRLEIRDSDFLQRTAGHHLPLKNGSYDPAKDDGMDPKEKKIKGASTLLLKYHYDLHRVE
jgi:hypothetical protein